MHYREIYECGHVGRSCYCDPDPPIQPMVGVCADCESKKVEERPSFNTLHALALRMMADNYRSGVPEYACALMVYDWLYGLATYDVADESDIHSVMVTLEYDGALDRAEFAPARNRVLDALQA